MVIRSEVFKDIESRWSICTSVGIDSFIRLKVHGTFNKRRKEHISKVFIFLCSLFLTDQLLEANMKILLII